MKTESLENHTGRILVVGDLHGMYEEALQLLSVAEATPEDTVIFAGDLVDRGPDNDKCVDLAMRHKAVLGNHEAQHLKYRAREEAGEDPRCNSPNHIAARAQLRAEHYEWFKTLPLIIRLPQYNAAVVHAGVFPGVPLEGQSETHLLHLQMIRPPEPTSRWPSKIKEGEVGWQFWTNFWKGPEKIIFGHSVIDQPLVTEFAVGIDGGAVFGRELWAYELPSGKIHRVLSHTDHGKGSRGTSGPAIKTFPIHGDVSTYS